MKSWYHQTDKGYGQGDALSPEEYKKKLLLWGIITPHEASNIEIWEAVKGGREPCLPRSKSQAQKEG